MPKMDKSLCVGKRIGRLIITGRDMLIKSGRSYYKCLCICGNTKSIRMDHLVKAETNSCGCIQREAIIKTARRHGMSHTATFWTWTRMKGRCSNKKNSSFRNYGGRGIKVCERWHKFENFYEDMGDKPINKSIDRINNNGNYEPSNCRWADNYQQTNNRRFNVVLEFNGEKMTVSNWARHIDINAKSLYNRIHLGWPTERILTEPVRIMRNR